MKDTTHTPGPWHSTKDGRIYSESATEWNRTANCESAAWIAATGASEANARLIAAAPELLEACKLMLLEHQALSLATGCGSGDRWSSAATAARAAIAKATGAT